MDLESVLATAEDTGICHLCYLGLREIPLKVFELKNLTRLDIGHNDIAVIPPQIGNLTQLEELWCNDNPLTSLPPDISSCLKLAFINLQRTDIVKLPREIARLPSLYECNLSDTPLKPTLQAVYLKAGTDGLVNFLRMKDEKRALRAALLERLEYDVFPEESAREGARDALTDAVKRIVTEFADFTELKTVIRNAARLFPATIGEISPAAVRFRYDALMRDNTRKQLGADLELKIRALYYDRIDVTLVEGIVNGIVAAIPTLDDMQFLLQHAQTLFPANAADINPATLHSALLALRTKLAEERAAAVAALTKAMLTMFPDADPSSVQLMAAAIAGRIPKTDNIRSVAADAAEIFPADFSNVKVNSVLRAFTALQQEKGVA